MLEASRLITPEALRLIMSPPHTKGGPLMTFSPFGHFPQFIVGEDGSCGLVYEHSSSEGPPIVALLDHVFEYW